MIKMIAGKMTGLYNSLKFKYKLWKMDEMWRYFRGGCLGFFPPSFYYTHTREEAEQVARQEIAKLRAMLNEIKE